MTSSKLQAPTIPPVTGVLCSVIACVLFLLFPISASSQQEAPKKEGNTEAQAPTVKRITVDGKAMKKKLVHKVTPKYPQDAMHQRVSGTVVLRVLIGVDGSIKDMHYVSGPSMLVQATIDGVRQYKYQPSTQDGQPVEVDTTVETEFEIR